MTASRWSSGAPRRRAPSMPSAPACASMSDTADRVRGRKPEFLGRDFRRAVPRRSPGLRTSVPMRTNPSAARSPRPIAAKYDASHRRSWPRYVHLHTVLHSERCLDPVARHVRKSAKVEPVRGASPRLGQVLLHPAQLRRLHLRRDRPADELEHWMSGRVDRLRVVDRAMVHPDDDVAAVVAVEAIVTGLPVRVDRNQRARRVEPDARRLPRRRRPQSRREPRAQTACQMSSDDCST